MKRAKVSRRNCNRISLTKQAAVVVSIAAMVIGCICDVAVGQSSKLAAGEENKEIVKRVKQFPDSPISFENVDGVSLFIQYATAKQIGSTEYYQLTGRMTDSSTYTAFPNVTLTNNSNKRVTSFALLLGNRRTRRVHWVNFYKITIEPHGTYSVSPRDWVLPEKIVRITDKGQVINTKRPADLNSEKMWLPSSVTDLILRVGIVQLEGGERWVIDDSKGVWQ